MRRHDGRPAALPAVPRHGVGHAGGRVHVTGRSVCARRERG
jgi:hypothetical protein